MTGRFEDLWTRWNPLSKRRREVPPEVILIPGPRCNLLWPVLRDVEPAARLGPLLEGCAEPGGRLPDRSRCWRCEPWPGSGDESPPDPWMPRHVLRRARRSRSPRPPWRDPAGEVRPTVLVDAEVFARHQDFFRLGLARHRLVVVVADHAGHGARSATAALADHHDLVQQTVDGLLRAAGLPSRLCLSARLAACVDSAFSSPEGVEPGPVFRLDEAPLHGSRVPWGGGGVDPVEAAIRAILDRVPPAERALPPMSLTCLVEPVFTSVFGAPSPLPSVGQRRWRVRAPAAVLGSVLATFKGWLARHVEEEVEITLEAHGGYLFVQVIADGWACPAGATALRRADGDLLEARGITDPAWWEVAEALCQLGGGAHAWPATEGQGSRHLLWLPLEPTPAGPVPPDLRPRDPTGSSLDPPARRRLVG